MKLYLKPIAILLLIFSSFMSVGLGQDCDENMYWSDCGIPFECNPTCLNPDPPQDCFTLCEVGCFCNEGYIFSDDSFIECILLEYCLEQLICDEGEVDLGWGNCNELWSGHTDGCMSSGCYSVEQTTELIRTYTIVGEIPSEIGELVNLTRIYIEGCDISGEIPLEIGNLVNLQSFYIYDNEELFESSGLTGEIPDEIGNLTNLELIVLSNNQLIGGIPESLGNLTNLDGLSLSNNQLDGEIPVWIENLINLTYLGLDGNQFMGQIPSTIGNLIDLYQLNLQNNQLSGEIPIEFCNPSIVHLDNNQLCPPYPECLCVSCIGYQDTSECEEPSICDEGYTEIDGECYYQSDLDVVQDFIDSNESLNGYSPITLTSPNNWLNGRLKTFLLYDRDITSIPESIGNLDGLDMIYFFDNEIESVPESIGNLIHLTFLDVGRNNISNIPDTIWNLVNLTTLNFQENQLISISDEVCNIYSNLEYEPFLSMNQICPPYPECLTEENLGYQDTSNCEEEPLCEGGYVELWGECYAITFTTYLNLSEMGLSGEIPSEIGNLTNLTNLDLGGNQLSGEIPSEIGNLINLTVLDLGGNQLSGGIPSEIGDLTNLMELELGGNQLSGSIPSEIGNLNNLTFLHLEYNQLSGSIPSEIANLTNLMWLNFINNQLAGEIPSIICNLDMNWSNPNNFNIYDNQLCPPYPSCIEEYVGEQDTSACVENCSFPGDINNDSVLNLLDIVSMITLILDGLYHECGDVNSDGYLNILDIITFVNIILYIP